MKLIAAIIEPFKPDDLRQTVAHIGVQGLTVTEVLGLGRQLGHIERYRSSGALGAAANRTTSVGERK